MTSSYRATSQASVRSTPSDAGTAAGAWAPSELALPLGARSSSAPASSPASSPVAAALSAEQRASLIDEGYARGLADGERKGLAAAYGEVQDAVAVLSNVIEKMREVASLGPSILEENIAALAVVVARQIVARAVDLEPVLVADLVRRALTEFPIDQSVRIRVHPLDLSMLTLNAGAHEATPITGARDVSWLADARVARGGCLVEGRDRIIDGRVDTALERAYHRMAQIDAS